MNAADYLKKHGEGHCEAIARLAGTTLTYFKQCAEGKRCPSRKLAVRLEEASSGEMQRHELVFPELAKPAKSRKRREVRANG